MIASHQHDWYDRLFAAQFVYNTAYHETVGDTSYRIIFKDSPRTTLQVAADLVHSESIDEHLLPSAYEELLKCMKVFKRDLDRRKKSENNSTVKEFKILVNTRLVTWYMDHCNVSKGEVSVIIASVDRTLCCNPTLV